MRQLLPGIQGYRQVAIAGAVLRWQRAHPASGERGTGAAGVRHRVHYGASAADQESVETDRCPGCGAKVRPDASWCTLCYQDLRPEPLLVSSAAQADATDPGSTASAPYVEASLEPEPAPWNSGPADDDIVDAELVGEDGRIIAPRTGAHEAIAQPTGSTELDLDEPGPVEPSKLATLTWVCKCGEVVSMADSICSVCGGSFLGDLREGNAGRHRPGNKALSWLPESRQVRLTLSVFAAITLSVLLTVLMSLFG
jgi:hypothetical protein